LKTFSATFTQSVFIKKRGKKFEGMAKGNDECKQIKLFNFFKFIILIGFKICKLKILLNKSFYLKALKT
jgi:hypothetical protein